MSPRPRLLLIGGGHAHLRVLRSLAEDDWPDVETLLVSAESRPFYSGMVPGYLQDQYTTDELSVDLPALCSAGDVGFVQARAERVDVTERFVRTRGGTFPFTLASLDIGSVPQGLDLPGVREHAFCLRPMNAAVRLRARVDELCDELCSEATIGHPAVRTAVVGAGAAGIEVALALHRRIRDAGVNADVALIERADHVLEGYADRARVRARAILERAGVRLLLGREVVAVEPNAIRLAGGAIIHADLVVWVSGSSAPPLIGRSRLPRSAAGYFWVDAKLRSADGAPVWGAGDCVDLVGHDLPKAGVYAVREGPVLAHNLKAALVGDVPREYRPQGAFLSLLNTADGKALLCWKGAVSHSRPAWWLKHWIDRRFVRQYSAPGQMRRCHI